MQELMPEDMKVEREGGRGGGWGEREGGGAPQDVEAYTFFFPLQCNLEALLVELSTLKQTHYFKYF